MKLLRLKAQTTEKPHLEVAIVLNNTKSTTQRMMDHGILARPGISSTNESKDMVATGPMMRTSSR
jgi:hypothetical protein